MPEKVIHEIRLNQYIAYPADRTRRFCLGTRDSYGVEQLRIVPGEGWDGLTITATFHPPEGEAVQVLVPADGLIDVPPEATRSGSELPIRYGKIVFAGVADGVQRISCNLPYTVMDHAPVDGAASSGPSPSWYEQAAAHFVPSGGKAGQVLAKASDTDLDVEWADGGNGTADHAKLSNRDASDQHPISAITGLEKALEGKQPVGSYITEESDPTVPEWAKQPQKPAYTASEVGADPSGTAASRVSAHNTGTDTHSDIRLLIQGLTDRLNALADSDDTTLDQLSEVVAYIKSNRDLISSITTDKVSVADIVDNLTTNVANKPLSAAQGVALKALIDAITIPDALPNPNALTFTGAVTGSYDGSAPLSVEIPSGGGGGAVSTLKKVWSFDITETIADLKQIINFAGPVRRIVIIGKALEGSTSSASRAGIGFKQPGLAYAETLNMNGVVGESGTPIYSSAVFDVFAGGYVCEFLTNRSSDFHTWNHLVTTHYYYVNPDMMAEWDTIWFNVWNVSSGSIEIWTDAEVLG